MKYQVKLIFNTGERWSCTLESSGHVDALQSALNLMHTDSKIKIKNVPVIVSIEMVGAEMPVIIHDDTPPTIEAQ